MPRASGPITIVLLAGVAGCAARDVYPSLGPRPIERVSLAEPVPRPVPAPTAPAIADVRYAPLVEKARKGDGAFRARLEGARHVLTAGHAAPVGSDAWGAAQQALSRLQEARTPVVEAVAALQAATETPDTQADRGLADAAGRALDAVRTIDAGEARALAEATPRAS